mgnify:CR=1 FL=1|tara:strand:+ start:976 stop:1212 length:237 start_codon:yes stop_codon:yes gene_type:complete
MGVQGVQGYICDNCPDLSLNDLLSELPMMDALDLLMEYFKKAGHSAIIDELGEWVYDDPRPDAIDLVSSIHKQMEERN